MKNGPLDPQALQRVIGWVSLVLLVVQNCASVLLMRWCLTRPGAADFSRSAAIVVSECVKLGACLTMMALQRTPLTDLRNGDPIKLLVPSGLYSLQHYLLYVALANLDAATFQVVYQSKVLTTAVFMVLLLGHSISRFKWFALVVLFCGIVLTQVGNNTKPQSTSGAAEDQSVATGLVAVFASSLCSAVSSVYLEKIVKQPTASLVVRNVQLAVFTSLLSLPVYSLVEHRQWEDFMKGIDGGVWSIIAVQAAGGLLVATVIKYADNILKGFATSISIVVGGVASYFIFDFHPSAYFMLGAALVVSASGMYSLPDAPSPPPVPSAHDDLRPTLERDTKP